MSRPISSNISYPFVDTEADEYLKCVKDAVFTLSGTRDATTPDTGITTPSVSLRSILGRTLTFWALSESSDAGVLDVHIISFDVPPAEGLGMLRSTNKPTCCVLLDFSEYIEPSAAITYTLGDRSIEPCLSRWLTSSLTKLTLVNEWREADPTNRNNLSNAILTSVVAPDPIRINNGYNVDIFLSDSQLSFFGSSGAGVGRAPDNMWDGVAPSEPLEPVLSINGEKPNGGGDFIISGSSGVSVHVEDVSTLVISDNHEGAP